MADEKKGLPFTIDHRRMFEKTMESRFKSPFHDIEEATKLALENASSYVSINERRSGFSIEFDGGSVDSQEGLIGLVRDLYSDNKKDMGRLGTAVASALSNKPESVSLTTACDEGGSLRLEMEGMDPLVEPLDEKVDRTHFEIRRKNKNPKEKRRVRDAEDFFHECWKLPLECTTKTIEHVSKAAMHPGKAWNSVAKGNRDYHKSRFQELVRYSSVEVAYNGEKLKTGLTHDNAIFQETYTFDDATVNLSVPKSEVGDGRRTVRFVRNGVYVGQVDYRHAMESEDGPGRREDHSTPNIIIESPYFTTNISEEIILDSQYESLISRVDEAINSFHLDYLRGKFPSKSSGYLSREWDIRKKFEGDLFYNLLESDDFKQALFKRIRGEHTGNDGFDSLDQPLLEDLWGKQYSLAEAYSAIKENNFTFYTTDRKDVKPHHPALDLKSDDLAFRLRNRSHKNLLQRVVSTMHRQENPPSKRYDSLLGRRKTVGIQPKIRDLDGIVQTYEQNKREKQLEAWERGKVAAKEGLKTGGYASAVAGAGAGAWFGAPYAVSLAKWTALLVASNPVLTASPFLAVGAGYGLCQSLPYMKKGIGYTVNATRNALPQGKKSSQPLKVEGADDGESEDKETDKKGRVERTSTPLKNAPHHERDYFERLIRELNTGVLSNTLGKKEVVLKEKNASRFFKWAPMDEMPDYFLDVTGNDFKKRAERFWQEGDAAIYKDLGDIVKESAPTKNLHLRDQNNEALVATMFRDAVNSVFHEFSEDSEGFRKHFPSMSYEARGYVLRRILQAGASGPHDQWLEKTFPKELDEAAQNVMGDTYPERLTRQIRESLGSRGDMRPEMMLACYRSLTPEEVETALELHLKTDDFLRDTSIPQLHQIRYAPLIYIREDDDMNYEKHKEFRKTFSVIARAFPLETMSFAIRKKKEQLDTIVADYHEGNLKSEAVTDFVSSVWDRAYIHRRVQSLTSNEAGIAPYMDHQERGKMYSVIQNARNFNLPLDERDMLHETHVIKIDKDDVYAPANALIATHLLQPPEKQGEFKQYLRDNFLHTDAFVLYNAIENTLNEKLTHR